MISGSLFLLVVVWMSTMKKISVEKPSFGKLGPMYKNEKEAGKCKILTGNY